MIKFFIFIALTQQLNQPITEQHGSKYKMNNKNIKKHNSTLNSKTQIIQRNSLSTKNIIH
jgi:hypothetical protein